MNTYRRNVETAPEKLVTNGRFRFGTYNTPFEIVNPLDAINPLPVRVPKFVKSMRLKEWEAFQIGNRDFFILAAVYNSKGPGIVQFIVIDRKKHQKYRFQRFLPCWKTRVASSLMNTVTCSHGRDFSFYIHNYLRHDRIFFHFRCAGKKKHPDMSCRVEADHSRSVCTPIVICQPFDDNRALYSHKALMPLSGQLFIKDSVYEFNQNDSFMIVDDHKGYYPFEMTYDWVTAAGHDSQNRLIGFNLTDNQVRDPHQYNENCLWLDGDMQPLPPIRIDRPEGVMGPWRITDPYDRVNLTFTPAFDGRIDINLIVFKTDYRAPYGTFTGHILDKDDNKIVFDDFFGVGEKKYIKA